MINFSNLYKNHFNTKSISDDNLQKGTEEHIGRVIANNGSGTFNTILTNTNTAYTNYFGSMGSEEIAHAVQQSLTVSVDVIIKSFKDDASRYEGTVRGLYGKTSATYQEFYPLGIDEYHQATKANIKLLMTRLAAAFNAHSVDFAPAIVTLFTNYPTNFQSGRDAQLLKIGEVSTDKVGTAASRDVLETQLLTNLFFIGTVYPGNVAQCMAFWNQSMFQPDIDTDHDGLGQLEGVCRKAGVVVSGVVVEVLGTSYKKRHSATDGRFRTSKMEAPKLYNFRATFPTGEVVDSSKLVTDEGITGLDFDI